MFMLSRFIQPSHGTGSMMDLPTDSVRVYPQSQMAGKRRKATETIQKVGVTVLELLRREEFASLQALTSASGWSKETVKRALRWLRGRGAAIEFVQHRGYRLTSRDFSVPLVEPSSDDLLAALTAAGLLRQLGLSRPAGRAEALFRELAQQLDGQNTAKIRPDAIRVTQTVAPVTRPDWLAKVLGAVKTGVLRVDYQSTWEAQPATHIFEPWQVWLHDGVLYVTGFSRTRRAQRTLRFANMRSVSLRHGDRPREMVPEELVAGADTRCAIDEDRPGTAVIQIRGSVARWAGALRWHPGQEDMWIERDQLLQRTLPYRSCRELARRLVSVGDGLESVQPQELADEVARIAGGALDATRNRRRTVVEPARPA